MANNADRSILVSAWLWFGQKSENIQFFPLFDPKTVKTTMKKFSIMRSRELSGNYTSKMVILLHHFEEHISAVFCDT